LDKSGIDAAEYMTEPPKRELLKQKFYNVVEPGRGNGWKGNPRSAMQ